MIRIIIYSNNKYLIKNLLFHTYKYIYVSQVSNIIKKYISKGQYE